MIFEFWRHIIHWTKKMMWHGEWCIGHSSWVLKFVSRLLCTLNPPKKTFSKNSGFLTALAIIFLSPTNHRGRIMDLLSCTDVYIVYICACAFTKHPM